MEWRQAFAYRADFWLQFGFSLFSTLGVAYFLWRSVFNARGVESLQGYSFQAMMLYYCMVPLIDRLNRGYDNFTFSGEIYDGTLTRVLMYPVPALSFKLAGVFAKSALSVMQFLLGLALFTLVFGWPAEIKISVSAILMSLSLCLLVSVTYFALASMVEMVAFWADNVWSLMVMLRFFIQIFSGGLIPLEFFPSWARSALDWTIFPYVIARPIRLLLGYDGLREWGFAMLVVLIWLGALSWMMGLVWRAGLRRYSGVGI